MTNQTSVRNYINDNSVYEVKDWGGGLPPPPPINRWWITGAQHVLSAVFSVQSIVLYQNV